MLSSCVYTTVQKRARWLGRRVLPEAQHGGPALWKAPLVRIAGCVAACLMLAFAGIPDAEAQIYYPTVTPTQGKLNDTFSVSYFVGVPFSDFPAYLYLEKGSIDTRMESCQDLRDLGNPRDNAVQIATVSVNSRGDANFANVRVTRDFMNGDGNFLCVLSRSSSSADASGFVEFTAYIPEFVPSSENLELRKNTSKTFTLKLSYAPSEPTTWLLRADSKVARLQIEPIDPFAPPPDEYYEPEVTFTPTDWNVPRTVRVTGYGAGTTNVSAFYVDGDPDYRNVSLNVPLTVTGPPPNAFVLPRTYLDLTAGETRRFSVRLASKPSAHVIGTWRLVSALDVQIAPALLTFDDTNWNQPQHIAVTGGSPGEGWISSVWVEGHNDLEALDRLLVRLDVSATKTIDVTLWNGMDRDGVIRLEEGGAGQGFSVALSEEPTGSVRVSATSRGGAVVYPGVLTFTPDNWSVRQDVGLHAIDDRDTDDEYGAVYLSASGGGYGRVEKTVAYCVDDAADDDETCRFRDVIRKPDQPTSGASAPGAEDGPQDVAHTGPGGWGFWWWASSGVTGRACAGRGSQHSSGRKSPGITRKAPRAGVARKV